MDEDQNEDQKPDGASTNYMGELLRQLHGLTVTEVARATGVSRQNLSTFFNKGTSLGIDKQIAVLAELGMSNSSLRSNEMHVWTVGDQLDLLKDGLSHLLTRSQFDSLLIVQLDGPVFGDALLLCPVERRMTYIFVRRVSLKTCVPITSKTLGFGKDVLHPFPITHEQYVSWGGGTDHWPTTKKEIRDFLIAECLSVGAEVLELPADAGSDFDAGLRAQVQIGLSKGLTETEILKRISIAMSV